MEAMSIHISLQRHLRCLGLLHFSKCKGLCLFIVSCCCAIILDNDNRVYFIALEDNEFHEGMILFVASYLSVDRKETVCALVSSQSLVLMSQISYKS